MGSRHSHHHHTNSKGAHHSSEEKLKSILHNPTNDHKIFDLFYSYDTNNNGIIGDLKTPPSLFLCNPKN